MHYNYKKYLKRFSRLFSNKYQWKVDNNILANSALFMSHKVIIFVFNFPILSNIKK